MYLEKVLKRPRGSHFFGVVPRGLYQRCEISLFSLPLELKDVASAICEELSSVTIGARMSRWKIRSMVSKMIISPTHK